MPDMRATTLTQRELARGLLEQLSDGRSRIPVREAREAAKRDGIGFRTLGRVRVELGYRLVHNGPFPAFWEAP